MDEHPWLNQVRPKHRQQAPCAAAARPPAACPWAPAARAARHWLRNAAAAHACSRLPPCTHALLPQVPLVVKPDMLFGQRGKNDLVGLKLSYTEAEEFVRGRMGKVVTIKGCSGPVTTFVVEPFVPHKEVRARAWRLRACQGLLAGVAQGCWLASQARRRKVAACHKGCLSAWQTKVAGSLQALTLHAARSPARSAGAALLPARAAPRCCPALPSRALHPQEYYLCIQSGRLDTEVSFSTAGGVEIEENWDKVATISIPTATPITGAQRARMRMRAATEVLCAQARLPRGAAQGCGAPQGCRTSCAGMQLLPHAPSVRLPASPCVCRRGAGAAGERAAAGAAADARDVYLQLPGRV